MLKTKWMEMPAGQAQNRGQGPVCWDSGYKLPPERSSERRSNNRSRLFSDEGMLAVLGGEETGDTEAHKKLYP